MQPTIKQLVADAQRIVVIQADNPDADSLGSALALEQILSEQGKHVALYCGVDMPGYLKYLQGWSRVLPDLPQQFDLSIVVDASTLTLLEQLTKNDQLQWLKTKPCIVLDHHGASQQPIDFASAILNDPTVASTGELIYRLARELDWPLDVISGEAIMASILGDTQGLSNDLAVASTYRVMAELLELGVSRSLLEEKRRDFSKMAPEIFRYKAELIRRTELLLDNQLAWVSIPQQEINDYSPLYNPAPLVQSDMLQTSGVRVSVVFKQYDDGHVTGAIRCNQGTPIAAELATTLGGGGHPYASGFKVTDGRSFDEIKRHCLETTADLLATLDQELHHETV